MRRVFPVEVSTCERCGGRTRLVEICTGPDPIVLDIEISLSVSDVLGHGVAVVTPDDGGGSVIEASVVLGDDLRELGADCLGVEDRVEPRPRRPAVEVPRRCREARPARERAPRAGRRGPALAS